MIDSQVRAYLKSRTYTDDLLDKEEVQSLLPGDHTIEGHFIRVEDPTVAWICRSMSSQLIGIQLRSIEKHEYRWVQADQAQHLPIIYGSPQDHEILYNTGKIIMTEGIFDRVAMKRCFPHYAVYARLSKGIAKQLLVFLDRYANHVVLAFDQDEPGMKAAEAAETRLKKGINAVSLTLPSKDPAQFLEKKGETYMRNFLQKQISAFEF